MSTTLIHRLSKVIEQDGFRVSFIRLNENEHRIEAINRTTGALYGPSDSLETITGLTGSGIERTLLNDQFSFTTTTDGIVDLQFSFYQKPISLTIQEFSKHENDMRKLQLSIDDLAVGNSNLLQKTRLQRRWFNAGITVIIIFIAFGIQQLGDLASKEAQLITENELLSQRISTLEPKTQRYFGKTLPSQWQEWSQGAFVEVDISHLNLTEIPHVTCSFSGTAIEGIGANVKTSVSVASPKTFKFFMVGSKYSYPTVHSLQNTGSFISYEICPFW